jgi:hypothetical protein
MRKPKAIVRDLLRPLYRGWETNHDPADTVFLAGSGRSGTTWISEILNADRSFRYIFEPFNCRKTAEWRNYEFQQYFPRRHDDPQAVAAAAQILSGRVHNAWVDSQNRAILARRRLVKDIRANLMLGWLKEQFPAMPLVLLVREPLAVIASRRRLGWGPALGLERLRRMPGLVEEHLDPHMGFIESRADDEFAMQVINWCVEHLVPLRQLREGEYHLLSYEAVLAEPLAAIRPVFDYLGLAIGPRHIAQLDRPSATASAQRRRQGTAVATAAPAGRGFSGEERASAGEILQRFGLGRLPGSSASPEPFGSAP